MAYQARVLHRWISRQPQLLRTATCLQPTQTVRASCLRLSSDSAQFYDEHLYKLPEEEAMSRDDWWGRSAGSSRPTRVIKGPHEGYLELREREWSQLVELSEVQQLHLFKTRLEAGKLDRTDGPHTVQSVGLSSRDALLLVRAAMMTFVLHVEARIASALGEGFYTIGPCGEELLAAMGLVLRETDPMALHYRHLATQIARHMGTRSPTDIITDRARAHVVSAKDPVSGGVHCSLGGDPYSFMVTSTLASQVPPAVGRALGASLARRLGLDRPFGPRPVSYVTIGDGSINNAHFLAGFNLASYAQYRGFKCPVVFGVSDNDICISLKGHGYLRNRFLATARQAMPVFQASGADILDVYAKGREAVDVARKESRPVLLVFDKLPRRFGHAATDRQNAYLTPEEISAAAHQNPIEGACQQLIDAGVATHQSLLEDLKLIEEECAKAFDAVATEPKVDLEDTMRRVNPASIEALHARAHPDAPLLSTGGPERTAVDSYTAVQKRGIERHETLDARRDALHGKPIVMRKAMTNVFEEQLRERPDLVYLGEDVEHGGYYLVTEELVKKFPNRVRDFPPDETTLVGAGIGFSQSDLLPVVEIPYAKYLDCGSDMFHEAVITNWLSNRQQPNGMVIRLQGFDRGVFGGNFHTHNSLHLPPGLDVVCYSNGNDYVRGMRYCLDRAKEGHVVMSVDCTNLLNQRHVMPGDNRWRFPYPAGGSILPWSDVVMYGSQDADVAIVTYGNGVYMSLMVQQALHEQSDGAISVAVIDTPYLSKPPPGLRAALSNMEAVVFADICKEGQNPYAGWITQLNEHGELPARWRCVAAKPTYNPLGSLITFLQPRDILSAVAHLRDLDPTMWAAAVGM